MEKKEFKAFLKELRMKNGVRYKQKCSKEENEAYMKLLEDGGDSYLPKGVYKEYQDGTFYSYCTDFDISEEEMHELLMHYQLRSINIIKKCVLFFTILMISSLVVCTLAVLVLLLGRY